MATQSRTQKDAGKIAADDAGETARVYRFLKLFYVFNVDQIDALPDGFGREVTRPAAQRPAAIE